MNKYITMREVLGTVGWNEVDPSLDSWRSVVLSRANEFLLPNHTFIWLHDCNDIRRFWCQDFRDGNKSISFRLLRPLRHLPSENKLAFKNSTVTYNNHSNLFISETFFNCVSRRFSESISTAANLEVRS